MPLTAKQMYQGAVHHALEKARKGQERDYALLFVRKMAADLQERRFYTSALVARKLLSELYDTPKILSLAGKYGLCVHCSELLGIVPNNPSSTQPPISNTGATPRQLKILEDYV